jgi:hypothetical protein
MCERFGIKLCTVGIGCPEQNNNTIFSILLDIILDTFLTFQIKGTC